MLAKENAAVETMVCTENQKEAENLMELVQQLEPGEQKELVAFIQGARFARTINKSEGSA